MKKKSIVLIVVLLLFGLTFLYFKYVYGWLEFQKNTDTPKEFLSHVEIKKDEYSRDSIKILKQLKFLLQNHEGSFYADDYFDSTELIVDSILYSPNFNRLAVFVMTKNPTYKQLDPNNKFDWYYDGSCYFGILQNDTIELYWLNDVLYTNYYDEQKLSNTIREFYFRMLASKDNNGKSRYLYNLNDIRFWNGPVWKEIEDKKIKKKEFEEEKKNHPENIYEPSKY